MLSPEPRGGACDGGEFHRRSRWRSGGLAARGARAAVRQAADHRFLGSAAHLTDEPTGRRILQRLRELGWIEGRTISDRVSLGGRIACERYAEIAAEFVRLKVDVIVTFGTAVPAVKQAHFGHPDRLCDRLRPGWQRAWSRRLARPGGNVTGLSVQSTDLAGKRLEILREVVPGAPPIGGHGQRASFPGAVQEMGEVQAAARTLGLEVATSEIRRAEDIAPAFDALKERADALYVCRRSAHVHQPDSTSIP